MAQADCFAPRVPAAERPVRSSTDGFDTHEPPTSDPIPTTLTEFRERVCDDRDWAARLAARPDRVDQIATRLLETDPLSLEMYGDPETLAAYLRAILSR